MKKRFYLIIITLFAGLLLIRTAQAADYTNSIGMEFINIPAGSFYMGSCKLNAVDKQANEKRRFMGLPAQGAACPSGAATDNDASDDETPQHKVRISKGFQLGVYEVTLGQFKSFIADTGRVDLLTDFFMQHNRHGDSAAVSVVSWENAQAFILWLNRKEGGNSYRLPTEAEWEYAARAGTTTVYFWGDSASEVGNYAWYSGNSYNDSYAHVVGTKQPNPWGLYDMYGNVSEWVQDWYDERYYGNSPTTDPLAPGPGRDGFRLVRGGCWMDRAERLRSSYREGRPDTRNYLLGFRLLRQP